MNLPEDKKKKRDFNNKKDNHFDKINALIDGGKYTHNMNDSLDKAHAAVAKAEMKGYKK